MIREKLDQKNIDIIMDVVGAVNALIVIFMLSAALCPSSSVTVRVTW